MTQSTGFGPQWPTPPAPKRPKRWPWAVGIATAFVVGLAIGNAGESSSAPIAQSSAPRATYTAPTYSPPVTVAPAAPVVPDGSIANGLYEIGADVEPGKYLSPGAEEGSFSLCYVDVQRGNNFLLQEVVPEGQVRITIEPSWTGADLKVSGCQPFAKAD